MEDKEERTTSDIFPQRTSGLGQPDVTEMTWDKIDRKIDELKMILKDLQKSNTKSTTRDRDVGSRNLV